MEVALLGTVLGAAIVLRLIGLADHTDASDEGIRGIQLRLLAAGSEPVSEIYSSQGPLSLWLFYPSVALFGPDILVGRLTVVAASMVVLLAASWIGRHLGGPIAGLATAVVLALSPVSLTSSRAAFVEMPSIAATLVGLVTLVVFRREGRRHWLIASAVLFAVGTLAKPMAAVAGLAALVLILAPANEVAPAPADPPIVANPGDRPRIVRPPGSLVCGRRPAAGAATLYEQVVTYRLGARAVNGWDLRDNARVIVEKLQGNSWGVLLATALGCAAIARGRRPLGVAVVAWIGGGIAALLLYSPLWGKHVTYILPPLAILAGVGFASVAPLAMRRWGRMQLALGLPAVVAISLVAISVPDLVARARGATYTPHSELSRHAHDLRLSRPPPRRFRGRGRCVPRHADRPPGAAVPGRPLVSPPPPPSADQAIDATRHMRAESIVSTIGATSAFLSWVDRDAVLVKSYVERGVCFRRVYAHPDAGSVPSARPESSLVAPTEKSGRARLAVQLDRRG